MSISITYCVQWNYEPQAASLADAIEKKTGTRPNLVQGGGGIFDVEVEGRRIFSKHEVGRFPTNEEILEKLQSAWSGDERAKRKGQGGL